MVFSGVVKDGVVVLPGDVCLPEGTHVRVQTVPAAQTAGNEDALYRLGEFAGSTGIPDLAVNIDHYLYGAPKVGDAQP